MITDEIRDADGCEDYESLEESGLHDTEEQPDTAETENLTEETAEDGEAAESEEAEAEPEDAEAEADAEDEDDPIKQELAEMHDLYQRLRAEFDNYRNRTAKEKSETYQDAVAKTVNELLPAVDSFALAMAAPCTDEAYRSGIEKIYQQLNTILTKLGVEEIPALNETFDPKVHNAIRQIEDEEFGESTVCEVYQKGYRLGSRIIRCAMVCVAN